MYAVGLLMELPWAQNLWIKPEMPFVGFAFVASIAASFAAPLLWIAYSGDLAALRPLAIYGAVTASGCSFYLLGVEGVDRSRIFALAFGAAALVSVGVIAAMKRADYREPVAAPRSLHRIFGGLALLLVLLGGALLLGVPHVFPFPLSPLISALYGWVFLGAAAYLVVGARSPVRQDSCGQLMGLLAYDLVLLKPYANQLGVVAPENRASLIVYLAMIAATAVMCLVYLARGGAATSPAPGSS